MNKITIKSFYDEKFIREMFYMSQNKFNYMLENKILESSFVSAPEYFSFSKAINKMFNRFCK
jgi:hypothetical protein